MFTLNSQILNRCIQTAWAKCPFQTQQPIFLCGSILFIAQFPAFVLGILVSQGNTCRTEFVCCTQVPDGRLVGISQTTPVTDQGQRTIVVTQRNSVTVIVSTIIYNAYHTTFRILGIAAQRIGSTKVETTPVQTVITNRIRNTGRTLGTVNHTSNTILIEWIELTDSFSRQFVDTTQTNGTPVAAFQTNVGSTIPIRYLIFIAYIFGTF